MGFVLVILSAALAGCTGSDDVDPNGGNAAKDDKNAGTTGGENGNGDDGGSEGQTGEAYGFATENMSALDMSASGSFSATEHCLPVNCFTDSDTHLHFVDLEEILPVGIPVLVEVELESNAEITAGVGGRFLSEGALWNLTPVQQSSSQESVIVARPTADAKLYYVVEGLFPNPGADTEWTLHAQATPRSGNIPEGFVVGFQVDDPDRPPTFHSTRFTVGTFMLFDPDDEYLGTYRTDSNTSIPFEESGKSGEYVLFVPWDEVALELKTHPEAASPPALRPLGISRTDGEFQASVPQSPVEWDFDVGPTALAVGIMIRAETSYMATEERLYLESPSGVLFDDSLCGFCINGLGASQNTLWWDATQTVVVPGQYEARYQNNGYGTEVSEIVWDYER